jgi:hypothetical protein
MAQVYKGKTTIIPTSNMQQAVRNRVLVGKSGKNGKFTHFLFEGRYFPNKRPIIRDGLHVVYFLFQ